MLDPQKQAEIIAKGRRFMRSIWDGELAEFESDQDLKLPQPPLVKAPMRPNETPIDLPRDFDTLSMERDVISVFTQRRSRRHYTEEGMNLLQLSFLLWASQGVKGLRGKSYATLRTVPSGGARHPFETYLLVNRVEGLASGRYHYLPMSHQLEYLGELGDFQNIVDVTLHGQTWAARADVIFYYTIVPYRAEWRYGVFAHRICLVDAGHVGQNLYLASTALGLGTCGIGAFSDEAANALFDLDAEEEFVVYVFPVGTFKAANESQEQAFYQAIIDAGY